MLTRALVCPTLVGRDEELGALVERRLAASRGLGSLVLLSGDAGIGKSRLLQAFRQTLSGGRASLGVGLNREFGNAPYGAVTEALEALGGHAPAGLAQNQAEYLSGLTAEFARLSAQRTIVLFIEDLHWADDGTLLFLQHVLPAISSLRLLAVATYRCDDVGRLEDLERSLSRMERSRATHCIELHPLHPAQIRRIVQLAAGDDRRLPDALVEEIVERCDGNPFFAEELLKNALETGEGQRSNRLPLTVRATVLERVAGLDPSSRSILSRAALFGRRFDAGFLAQLCGVDLDEMLEVLRRFRNLQLIDELSGDPPSFAFRHALTQEAIYCELLGAEARPLHARILGALEKQGAAARDLGYHAWAAADAAKCVLYNERAGDEAQALHAHGEAVRSYDRALSLAPRGEVRARLLERSAKSLASGGKAAQALDRYAAAADEYKRCGHFDAIPAALLGMSAQARVGGDNRRGMAILQDALETMQGLPEIDRAMMQLSLAYLHLDRHEVDAGKSLIARSQAAALTPGYRDAVQYAMLVAGDLHGFRNVATENAVVFRRLGDPERLRFEFNRAFGFTILGCDSQALEAFEAILPELREKRFASYEMLSLANSALIHARRGQLAAAKDALERAAAIPSPTTTGPIALAAAALTVGFALWDEELVARLCSPEIVEAAFASHINSTLGRIAGPYARWLSAGGDAAGARSILSRAMESLNGPCGATETFIAAAELGDEAARSRAFGFIDRLESMAASPVYAATVAHLRALRELHNGNDTGTRLRVREASEQYARLGWPLHQAACAQLGGEVKRASAQYRRLNAAGPLREPRNTAAAGCGIRDAFRTRTRDRRTGSTRYDQQTHRRALIG